MKKIKIALFFLLAIITSFAVMAMTACGDGNDNTDDSLPKGSEVVEEITAYEGAVELKGRFDYAVGQDAGSGSFTLLYIVEGQPVDGDYSGITASIDITAAIDEQSVSAYVRVGQDVLTAYLPSETQGVYSKTVVNDLSEMLKAGFATPELTSHVALEESSLSMVDLITLILNGDAVQSQAINNVIDNCVKVEKAEGGFKLSFDLIDYASYNIDELVTIAQTITNKTTVGGLYASEEFKSWFELTFKDVKAKQLYDGIIDIAEAAGETEVLMVVYSLPEPTEEESVYDWINEVLNTELAMMGGKLSDINLFTLLDVTAADIEEFVNQLIETKQKLQVNELAIGVTVKNTKVTGVSFTCNLPVSEQNTQAVNVSAQITLQQVQNAPFVDVTTLTVAQQPEQ